MNVERLLEFADFIEHVGEAPFERGNKKRGFNMSTWYSDDFGRRAEDRSGHNCNTTACIAGWVQLRETGNKDGYGAFDFAKEYFGLTTHQADRLFVPANMRDPRATNKVAAQVLRQFAATGRVMWNANMDGRVGPKTKAATEKLMSAYELGKA